MFYTVSEESSVAGDESKSDVFLNIQTIVKEIRKYQLYLKIGYLCYPLVFGYYIVKNSKKQIEDRINEISFIQKKIKEDIERKFIDLKYSYNDIKEKDTYLIYSVKSYLLNQFDQFIKELSLYEGYEEFFAKDLNFYIFNANQEITTLKNTIEGYNKAFIQKRKIQYDSLFKLGPFPLDDDQKTAIITDDKYNLVVAGAGSGKTEVLTTRIAYLIKRKSDTIKAERILALAFQHDAAEEIRNRLSKRYQVDLKIKTFHALGLEILKKANARYKLYGGDNYEKETKKLVEKILETSMEDIKFQELVIHFLKQIGAPDDLKKEEDFQTTEEFYHYQRELRYTTLDGTLVKSIGEREIMNFFLTHKLNGEKIQIQYEDYADWMSYVDNQGQHQTPTPDFFLPDFNIYIEHWSLDVNGKIPQWYQGDYIGAMNIKKQKFAEQNIFTLVETTFGEFASHPDFEKLLEQRILNALMKKYPGQQFEFTPLRYNELISQVWEDCQASLRSLPHNIFNFIMIAKTYRFKPDDVEERLITENWSRLQKAFGFIAFKIYNAYEKILKEENSIDFGDMINESIDVLKKNNYLFRDSFDHILIDEYQDISTQRYHLVNALLEKNPRCKLFCVGDDWQSIMGFAGSNLYYFKNFDQKFDHPAITYLTTNYRSIKSIVDTGATIIKNNGNIQIQKKSIAKNSDTKPIKVYSLLHKENYRSRYYQQVADLCKKKIDAFLNDGYQAKDIMVLARIYNNPIFNENFLEYAHSKGIDYMSVHRSKGLQAKLVIVLNVNKGLYGFPCELEDPSIFEPAREFKLVDKEEEERRLFYVAVTRAKEDVIIYNQKCAESKFLKEIKNHTEVEEIPYN